MKQRGRRTEIIKIGVVRKEEEINKVKNKRSKEIREESKKRIKRENNSNKDSDGSLKQEFSTRGSPLCFERPACICFEILCHSV